MVYTTPCYNLLPSWFRNHFGGSARRKRRERRSVGRNSGTGIENFTEYSTENDSTIGPTEYSTEASTEEDLERLPSNSLYYKFNTKCGEDYCDRSKMSNVRTEVERILGEHGCNGIDPDKIIVPRCYTIKGVKNDDPYYNGRFNFLYFWIGQNVFEKNERISSFSQLMGKIHNILKEIEKYKVWDYTYESNDRTIFEHMKSVYEYYYDYQTIKGQLTSNTHPCNKDYYEHLQRIHEAHRKIQEYCTGRNQEDSYCVQFGKKFNNAEVPKPPTLKCNLVLTEAEVGTKYGWLTKSSSGACAHYSNYDEDDNVKKEMRTEVLGAYREREELAKSIVDAWCYIHKKGRFTDSNGEWCYYFYYWLGDQLFKEAKDGNSFSSAMNQVYQGLRKSGTGEKCNIMYENIDKLLFLHMKNVFDYAQNQALIPLKLREGGKSNSCIQALSKYLQRALKAYKAIESKCREGKENTPPYCSDFNTKYKTHLTELTRQAQCTVVNNETEPLKHIENSQPLVKVAQAQGPEAALASTMDGPISSVQEVSLPALSSKNLPSGTEFYNIFDDATKDRCTFTNGGVNALEKALRNKLQNQYTGISALAKMIANAYCYACTMKKQSPTHDDKPCQFFYHWLGKQITVEAYRSKLSKILEIIYDTLKSVFPEHKCTVNYKDVDSTKWELFNQRKKVFEHYYDYKTLEGKLHSGDPLCEVEWAEYEIDLTRACGAVRAYCGDSSNADDQYCAEFTQTYGMFCDKKLSELKCSAVYSGKSTAPAISGTIATIGGLATAVAFFLHKDLLSRRIYDIFGKSQVRDIYISGRNSGINLKSSLSSALQNYGKIGRHVDQIMGGWCYAVMSVFSDVLKDGPCHFLYYWIGNTVREDLGTNSFSSVMGAIYSILGGIGVKTKCSNIDPKIDRNIFVHMEKVYNYTQDYTIIESYTENSETPEPQCTKEYVQYVQEAANAHEGMREYCKQSGKSEETWCNHFEKMFKKNNGNTIPEPSKLLSQLQPQPETPPAEGTSGVTTGVVGSTEEDNSTIYMGGPTSPSRRRGASNGKQGNRGRNISYQRM
ncbi:KIR protein [Plasmodium coatneyi]|uniref:KIR protein n=1 Tax=Plasmodium coatneyi TaxID=208452 RepID=A0A1B1DU32_9APIC|nr:KIR protein [Plasmodium coatneyi]ANQ06262.1 KIR protein [Plasmodium coatneyi]